MTNHSPRDPSEGRQESRPSFFDPRAPIECAHNHLPHWQQPGGTYFVTFRTADSLPPKVVEEWCRERESWMAAHPAPWSAATENEYVESFTPSFDRWLDEHQGACLLRRPEIRECLTACFAKFDHIRYRLHAWVIMPNHAHALFTLAENQTLESTLQGWKGVSARRINQLLGERGEFWQKDYFDRLIRSPRHFHFTRHYIEQNPVEARLAPGEFDLFLPPE